MQLECRRCCQLLLQGNETVGIVKHDESQADGCMRGLRSDDERRGSEIIYRGTEKMEKEETRGGSAKSPLSLI